MARYAATALEREELTGAVKKVMKTRYKAVYRDGKIEAGKIDLGTTYEHNNCVLTFNEQGVIIKDELYGATNRETNTYTEDGRPLEKLQYDSKGQLTQKSVHTYNDQNRVVEYLCTKADGSIYFRVVYTYNQYNQQTEHIHYMGPEQKILSRTVHEYGNFLKTTNGISQLNILSIREYDQDGALKMQNLFTYDERGNQLESDRQYTKPEQKKYGQRMVQKYNEHNDCIEMTFYEHDGTIKNHHTFSYEYDENGKKIIPPRQPKTEPEDEEEEDVNAKLETDARGNWIKKTTFSNEIPVHVYVRQIVYYDEEAGKDDLPFVHPATEAEPEDIVNTAYVPEPFSKEDAQWLVEGQNTTPEGFNLLRYYTLRFSETPSVTNFTGPYIEALVLLKLLKENMRAYVVHSYSTVWDGHREKLVRYTLGFPYQKYLLHATHIQSQDAEEFKVPDFMDHDILMNADTVHTSQFMLLHPAECTGSRDEDFEEYLNYNIDKCSLRKKPDKPTIRIIEVRNNQFSMEEHPVDDKFKIDDLDVHYGYGFSKFDAELMKRFQTQTKGLVLFHGQPGTGKTYYIRHLLRMMVARNRKIVIYMPPNMVDHLVEPAFMTFLTEQIQRFSEDGYFCVLLIEDAEPLLARRQEGVRIQGITNLLNMSDGLLNDLLNLQIICTFNVDLKKLDSALLRPGRLIARKEFKALSVLDANLLAQRLGIKHHFTAPATIAEVYSLQKNNDTLVHDVEHDQDASTLLDDLL